MDDAAGGPPLTREEIRKLYPELLVWANRWIAACRLQGKLEAGDLVQGALRALLEDKCPAGVSPRGFLKQRIKQAATNRARHHHKFPSTPYHPTDDDDGTVGELADTTSESADAAALRTERVGTTAKVMDFLLEKATNANDEEVFSILGAFQNDAYAGDGEKVKRARILEQTGLSAQKYQAALKRLETMLKDLPPELHADVMEELS